MENTKTPIEGIIELAKTTTDDQVLVQIVGQMSQQTVGPQFSLLPYQQAIDVLPAVIDNPNVSVSTLAYCTRFYNHMIKTFLSNLKINLTTYEAYSTLKEQLLIPKQNYLKLVKLCLDGFTKIAHKTQGYTTEPSQCESIQNVVLCNLESTNHMLLSTDIKKLNKDTELSFYNNVSDSIFGSITSDNIFDIITRVLDNVASRHYTDDNTILHNITSASEEELFSEPDTKRQKR